MRSMVSAWRVGALIGKSRSVASRARPHVTAVAHMVQFSARVEAALRDGHTRVERCDRCGHRLRDEGRGDKPVSVRALEGGRGRRVEEQSGRVAVSERLGRLGSRRAVSG